MNSSSQELPSELKQLLDDYLLRRALLESVLHSINQRSNETPLEREINQHNRSEVLRKIEELENRVAFETLRIQNELQH